MKELYQKNQLFFILLIVFAIGFLCWCFSEILICVVIAGVISIVGYPLVELFDKIRIGKFRFPHFLSAVLALLLIVSFIMGLISFFIPLVVRETTLISSINGQKLAEFYKPEIHWVEYNLIQLGVIKEGATLETILKENLSKIVDFSIFSNIISSVLSFTGTFFFNFFTVLFLSFFFLSDVTMLPKFVLLLVPEKYEDQVKHVMWKSKTLLSRYIIGLIINVLVMIASYAIVLSIVGVQGALVIAFVAGLLNIVPYIGPVIGLAIGIILGVTSVVSQGHYAEMVPMAIKVLIAMEAMVILDNVIYGPLIQGKSVKAHPIEIFLVIIAAGSLGGIPAMIVAVPGYAFLRIVAGEFFSQFRLVQKLSNN